MSVVNALVRYCPIHNVSLCSRNLWRILTKFCRLSNSILVKTDVHQYNRTTWKFSRCSLLLLTFLLFPCALVRYTSVWLLAYRIYILKNFGRSMSVSRSRQCYVATRKMSWPSNAGTMTTFARTMLISMCAWSWKQRIDRWERGGWPFQTSWIAIRRRISMLWRSYLKRWDMKWKWEHKLNFSYNLFVRRVYSRRGMDCTSPLPFRAQFIFQMEQNHGFQSLTTSLWMFWQRDFATGQFCFFSSTAIHFVVIITIICSLLAFSFCNEVVNWSP